MNAAAKANDWSPNLYALFEDERTLPVYDLLSRVPAYVRPRVVDLGCGPGNSTEALANRFPDAELLGLDNSPAMIDAARKRLPNVSFALADLNDWNAPGPFDLIFSNATLHWLPDHLRLMVGWLDRLAKGGCLAAQMPDNLDQPSHVLMREVAERPLYRERLAKASQARAKIGSFAEYYDALIAKASRVDVWRTTYVHALKGAGAIVDWVKATGLRPFLEPLTEEERESYARDYRAAIAEAYPTRADGRSLLPFPRIFIVARL